MKKKRVLSLSVALFILLLGGCSSPADAETAETEATPPVTRTAKEAEGLPDLSNGEKAQMVLESLASGDPQPITDYVSESGYIQHNLSFGEGRQTMLDALPALVEAGSTVEVQRRFTDGDYVFLHTKYALFGMPQAGFDIFRFEDGVIVEHWDNLDALVEETPSGHTQFDGPSESSDLDKTDENKALAEAFVRDVLMGENPDRLTDYFEGDQYIQHNVAIADGLSGLGEALADMAQAGIEMVYDEIHMVLGEGNFVLVVSEGTFGGAHTSYYDLFRVESGKIAEHWDVIESILPESAHANENGKY